ncbi:hypothetical protein FNV43_RR21921 [Rhamnella rubrinervis]|uniref:Uncharacterized protein n=1 Tax=Rhamnella rubrinervis TaxID=2594499 RepID=A0A8K0DV62_9ROSA|nr:hypothetical protein FNV43_RR21921 [Rhamnella rubrinervis]
MGETPFAMVYGTEVVILAEVAIPTLRVTLTEFENNDELRRRSLDRLEELREMVLLRMAVYQQRIARHYNTKVHLRKFMVHCLKERVPTLGRGLLSLSILFGLVFLVATLVFAWLRGGPISFLGLEPRDHLFSSLEEGIPCGIHYLFEGLNLLLKTFVHHNGIVQHRRFLLPWVIDLNDCLSKGARSSLPLRWRGFFSRDGYGQVLGLNEYHATRGWFRILVRSGSTGFEQEERYLWELALPRLRVQRGRLLGLLFGWPISNRVNDFTDSKRLRNLGLCSLELSLLTLNPTWGTRFCLATWSGSTTLTDKLEDANEGVEGEEEFEYSKVLQMKNVRRAHGASEKRRVESETEGFGARSLLFRITSKQLSVRGKFGFQNLKRHLGEQALGRAGGLLEGNLRLGSYMKRAKQRRSLERSSLT